MSASVDYLPIWKKGSTAEEWLLEIAAIARKHPERFSKAVIVMEETIPNGNTKQRVYRHEVMLNECIGMMEIAKADMIEESRN